MPVAAGAFEPFACESDDLGIMSRHLCFLLTCVCSVAVMASQSQTAMG
jgi:hypothetical protein